MRFNPFEKDLAEVDAADLGRLRDTPEGWYVEYKRTTNGLKGIAKSVSAFANQYGGWIFYGVDECMAPDGSKCAGAFPGMLNEDLGRAQEEVARASAHHVSPAPHYDVKVVSGPAPDLELDNGRSVLIVRVPLGEDAPYVHSSGGIYRRQADESDPVAETDRSALDLLWERGHRQQRRLAARFAAIPSISKGESESLSYAHLFVISDPHAESSGMSHMSLEGFVGGVAPDADQPRLSLKFDNAFRCGTDFIGRSVGVNDPELLVLTHRYGRDCSSLFTIPLNHRRPRSTGSLYEEFVQSHRTGAALLQLLDEQGYKNPTLVDLNPLIPSLLSASQRHRELALMDGCVGPFSAKLVFENMWRTIPYIDVEPYVEGVRKWGAPLMQDSRINVPADLDMINLEKSTAGEDHDVESDANVQFDVDILVAALAGLGVPLAAMTESELRDLVVSSIENAIGAEEGGAPDEPQ